MSEAVDDSLSLANDLNRIINSVRGDNLLDKEKIILLLPQPCTYYENLKAEFPLNDSFYDTKVQHFCSGNRDSKIDDLVRSLGVTVQGRSIYQTDGYSFWKAQGKVKRYDWLRSDYCEVRTIEELKEKLRTRVTAWKNSAETQTEQTPSACASSPLVKRPRPTFEENAFEENTFEEKTFEENTITVSDLGFNSIPPEFSFVDYTDLSSSFPSRLNEIRACQTIAQFIDMYDCGIVYDCLHRLRSAFNYYDQSLTQNEMAERWAIKLRNPLDAEAQRMDQDRKCCLELLYIMCNRWDPKDGNENTITDDDIIHGFQRKRILGILLPYCLPMDRAKSLYFMLSPMTGQRGIHWFAKQHETTIADDILIGFEPSINKRYFKLYGLKELELDKLPVLRDLLQYTLVDQRNEYMES